MTRAEQLAGFVSRASFNQLSPKARDQLKNSVLDALGCALGALGEQDDYEGFHTWPMSWSTVLQKFERLSYPVSTAALPQRLVEAVANLDRIPVTDLTDLLAQVRMGSASRHREERSL